MVKLLASFWLLSSLIAQSAPGGTNTATAVATLIVQLGLSGVFLWLYLSERSQREKRDDQIIELGTTLGPLAKTMTDTLERFQQSVAGTMNRAATIPDATDKLDVHERRLELAIDAVSELAEVLLRGQQQRAGDHDQKP